MAARSRIAVVALMVLAWVTHVWSTDSSESKIRLGAAEFQVFHEPPAGGLPALPDLSRSQRLSIPSRASFRVSAPILWRDSIVPPGEYELVLVVTEELRLKLFLSGRAGQDVEVPIERADYSTPSDELSVYLTAWSQGDRHRGVLQIRWGSLLLQGGFELLKKSVSSVDSVRLTTYDYPEELIPGNPMPIGILEKPEAGMKPRLLTVRQDRTGKRILRLEDQEYSRRVARRNALRREVSALRKVVRGVSESEDGARDRGRLRTLEARLKLVERQLTRSTATVDEIAATESPLPQPTVRVQARLEKRDRGLFMIVDLPPGRFSFELKGW